ncbi:hypothetical protein NS234_10165 [Microbacterium oxydans]|uniref:universal stress protein n=1 Tax=Microbacterium oxydans TaxID=82380 RepID=UPI000733E407|nr:universal stress protein [Microbacterium oxydans]KTR76792.1 hypothetical protein NS234_10165 [Microbacterium oxydans]
MVQPTARTTPTVVVGVVEDQSSAVVRTVAQLAASWRALVICAHVDTTRFVTGKNPDGSVTSAPIDSDLDDDSPAPFPDRAVAAFEVAFTRAGVAWETCELVGDPAQALADLADRTDAVMIVVGTRRPGFRGAMAEFFYGSVAVRLAHRQHRPVLVVPQAPATDGVLPWEGLA